MHCPAALWLQSHELLLQQGASLDGSKSSVEQAAVLCTAVFDGNLPLLRRLLTAGVSVDAGDYGARRVAVLGENAPSLIEGRTSALSVAACTLIHTAQYVVQLFALFVPNTLQTSAQRCTSALLRATCRQCGCWWRTEGRTLKVSRHMET
jgi:hypothetical protein